MSLTSLLRVLVDDAKAGAAVYGFVSRVAVAVDRDGPTGLARLCSRFGFNRGRAGRMLESAEVRRYLSTEARGLSVVVCLAPEWTGRIVTDGTADLTEAAPTDGTICHCLDDLSHTSEWDDLSHRVTICPAGDDLSHAGQRDDLSPYGTICPVGDNLSHENGAFLAQGENANASVPDIGEVKDTIVLSNRESTSEDGSVPSPPSLKKEHVLNVAPQLNLFVEEAPPRPAASPDAEVPAAKRRATRAEAAARRSAVAGDAFSRFWAAWPRDRRVKPDAAAACFRRAVDRGADPEEIIAGARRYAGHCEAEQTPAKFIAHPTTWLNDGRWKDDLPEPIDTSPEAMKRMSIVRRALTDEARFPEGGSWQLRAASGLRLINGFVVGDELPAEILAEVEAIKRDLDRATRAGVEVVDYRPSAAPTQVRMAPGVAIPALAALIAEGRS